MQIDSSVVAEMDDATMTAYRIFQHMMIGLLQGVSEKQTKGDDLRLSLFEKLRRKMCTTTSNKDTVTQIKILRRSILCSQQRCI